MTDDRTMVGSLSALSHAVIKLTIANDAIIRVIAEFIELPVSGRSAIIHTTCALPMVSGQSAHRLLLQFVGSLNLLLGEELRVLLVVLLAQVE